MAENVLMPKLGLTMTEGVVNKWMKKVGDSVKKGDEIVDISSEKLSYTVEAESEGILLEILVPEGEEVPVQTVIGRIGAESEKGTVSKTPTEVPEETKEEVTVLTESPTPTINSTQEPSSRIFATPLARKMATEKGFDLAQLTGTGENGRITRRDVESFVPQEVVAPVVATGVTTNNGTPEVFGEGLKGIRKAIAQNMQKSLRNTAQLTIMAKVDVSELVLLRKTLKDKTQETVPSQTWSLNIFLLKALGKVLKAYPTLNAHYDGNTYEMVDEVNIGVATSLQEGLIVPVIGNVAEKSLQQLQKDFAKVTQEAKDGKVSSENLTGGTFTITNLGGSGVEYFTPILNFPEVAILGIGAFQKNLEFSGENKEIVEKTFLPLSLTFDHQVIDGAPAAEFLKALREELETPFGLLG